MDGAQQGAGGVVVPGPCDDDALGCVQIKIKSQMQIGYALWKFAQARRKQAKEALVADDAPVRTADVESLLPKPAVVS